MEAKKGQSRRKRLNDMRFPAEMHIGDFLELCGIDAEFLIEGKTQVRGIRCVHLSSNILLSTQAHEPEIATTCTARPQGSMRSLKDVIASRLRA